MHPLRIDEIEFLRMSMPLKAPFTTSFGTIQDRQFAILRLRCEGVTGYGELVASQAPFYNEETVDTALHILRDFIAPQVKGKTFSHPEELVAVWKPIRRNYMAKAALEGAFWDAWAKARQKPLYQALGGGRERIEVGVSIGIQSDIPSLLRLIEGYLEEGYRRIKIKIQPGWDVDVVREIRKQFADVPLMVDANSAYSLADTDHLRRLDEFNLMMIEQPLAHDDIIDHAQLQPQLETPICLDESIHSVADARRALDLGACRIINIKAGRVGGLCAVKALHDLAVERNVPLWCGGMLESGVGRLHNVALTTLPGFTLPGDTSGSDRYWDQDIIEPPVTLNPDGTLTVPSGYGIGHEVLEDRLSKFLLERLVLGEGS